MLFTGFADAMVDAKQRLAIPAKFRSEFPEMASGERMRWYCVPWPGGFLRLYPGETFESLASLGVDSLTPGEDMAELEVTLYGLAERLELDGAGRIRLPHMELVGLPNEVTVVGARNRLEVRSRIVWQDSLADRFKRLASQVERVERHGNGSQAT